MSIKIKCPYCFKEFYDNEVHFRAPKATDRDNPPTYREGGENKKIENLERFKATFSGKEDERDSLIKQYNDWAFFLPQDDPKYKSFWKDYLGKETEDEFRLEQAGAQHKDIDDKRLKTKRRVIIPKEHKKYLKVVNQGVRDDENLEKYFHRDKDRGNMVYGLDVLIDNDVEFTDMRVCPHCHNPLIGGYGYYPVNFISLIGTTAAGKTVFLSQLLAGFTEYLHKTGLSLAGGKTESYENFIKKFMVEKGKELPPTTIPGRFEQPIIVNITGGNADSKTITLVLYDVAGEVFGGRDKDGNAYDIKKHAGFVLNTDGIILLIDPIQFEKIKEVEKKNGVNNENVRSPEDVLNTIYDEIIKRDKYNKPLAVCISKMDQLQAWKWLDGYRSLLEYCDTDYKGIPLENRRLCKNIFDMKKHENIEESLFDFIETNSGPLVTQLHNSFTNVHFFGVTALGNNCTIQDNKPVGKPKPHRIEEPLLWVLSQIGFIGINDSSCPYCNEEGGYITEKATEFEVVPRPPQGILEIIGHFFGKVYTMEIPREVNCKCCKCGKKYYRPGWKIEY